MLRRRREISMTIICMSDRNLLSRRDEDDAARAHAGELSAALLSKELSHYYLSIRIHIYSMRTRALLVIAGAERASKSEIVVISELTVRVLHACTRPHLHRTRRWK